MRLLSVLLVFIAGHASAQSLLSEGDEALSKAELTDYLTGNVLEFYTDGLATYRNDGTYDYRYSADGERVPGTYAVMDDSSVCVAFVNGFNRCDYLVKSGQRHVMIIENGERYPVKRVFAIE